MLRVTQVLSIAMGVVRALYSTSKALGRVPSVLYALMYLLLIPAFALIYRNLPGQFFHSTVQYEASVTRDRDALFEQLTRAARETYEMHGRSALAHVGWELQADALVVGHLSVATADSPPGAVIVETNPADNIVSFYLYGILTKRTTASDGDKQANIERLSPRITIWFNRRFPAYYKDGLEYFSVGVESDIKLPFDPGLIFAHKDPFHKQQPVLLATLPLRTHLDAWIQATRGFPAQATGEFWRMFYLSAATITTLGYGDIVPITATARMWVAVEAILGVVTIGLFLNSLNSERNQR